MSRMLQTQFKREDFQTPTRKALGNWFQQMLMVGQLRIVKDQDWRVDRLCPHFIDPLTVGQLFEPGDTVLHVGQGDNSACRHFHQVGPRHTSVCLADAIYVDPRTILAQRLMHEFPFRAREQDMRERDIDRLRIAGIMRDEFLVPAAMIPIANKDLRSLVGFSAKDFEIQRMKARYLRSVPNTDEALYLASYRALLEILEKKMSLLIPEMKDGRRLSRGISRLGGRLNYTQIANEDALRLGMLSADHQCLQPMSPEAVQSVAVSAFKEVCLQPDRMILGDFRNAEALLPKGERYGLIEGCRSDAFLKREYASILTKLVSRLSKGGVYLSDGILSSHTYEFFYREFVDAFLSKVGTGYSVWIILSSESDVFTFYPPMYMSGLVVARSDQRIPRIQEILAATERRMVRVTSEKDLLALAEVRHQIAWTEFVQLVRQEGQDLESFPAHALIAGLRSVVWEGNGPSHSQLQTLFHDLAI